MVGQEGPGSASKGIPEVRNGAQGVGDEGAVEEKDTVVVRGKVDAHGGVGSQLGGQWGVRNEEDGVSIEHGGGMAAQRPDKR